jgi:hypothetical protein
MGRTVASVGIRVTLMIKVTDFIRKFGSLEKGTLLTKVEGDEQSAALEAHVGDAPVHVSEADRTKWNNASGTTDYDELDNKPSIDGVTREGDKTAAELGLAEAADLSAHTGDTANPHGVTKAQVGLGNVDNTADEDKPVSAAQQTALDDEAEEREQGDSDTLGEAKEYTDDEIAAAIAATHTWLDSVDTYADLPAPADLDATKNYLCVVRDTNETYQLVAGATEWPPMDAPFTNANLYVDENELEEELAKLKHTLWLTTTGKLIGTKDTVLQNVDLSAPFPPTESNPKIGDRVIDLGGHTGTVVSVANGYNVSIDGFKGQESARIDAFTWSNLVALNIPELMTRLVQTNTEEYWVYNFQGQAFYAFGVVIEAIQGDPLPKPRLSTFVIPAPALGLSAQVDKYVKVGESDFTPPLASRYERTFIRQQSSDLLFSIDVGGGLPWHTQIHLEENDITFDLTDTDDVDPKNQLLVMTSTDLTLKTMGTTATSVARKDYVDKYVATYAEGWGS